MAKEKVTPFVLRLPEQLKKKVEKQAKKEKRSLNSQIIHLLEVCLTGNSDQFLSTKTI